MSDLISRSELIKHFNTIQQQECAIALDFVAAIDEIKEQPTAYDVDKVVKELEDSSKIYCEEYNQRDGNLYLLDAIEIVKQGGVSDDVCEWRLCDEEANVYDTSCRNPHILIEGTPTDNNYKYCPYCGRKILTKQEFKYEIRKQIDR